MARMALLLAGLICVASAARAAAATMSLDDYRSRLQQCRATAAAALRADDTPARRAATRAQLLAALPLQAEVSVPAGPVVSVDNHALGESLARALARPNQPARRAGLRRFVGAVDRLLSLPAPPIDDSRPAIDPSRADGTLRGVLSRPEFQTKDPGPSWEEKFLQWLARLLERLFPNAPVEYKGSDWPARVVMAVVVLLLAVLLARVLVLVLPNLRRRVRPEPELPEGEVLVPVEPDALLAAAVREGAAGRYREALRLAYQALVVRLDRAGVLSEDRSRTHWELLRDLRRSGRDPLYRELAPITRRMDERLFGGRTATVEDYQACRSVYTQMETLLCAV
jgi:hypothetical protein